MRISFIVLCTIFYAAGLPADRVIPEADLDFFEDENPTDKFLSEVMPEGPEISMFQTTQEDDDLLPKSYGMRSQFQPYGFNDDDEELIERGPPEGKGPPTEGPPKGHRGHHHSKGKGPNPQGEESINHHVAGVGEEHKVNKKAHKGKWRRVKGKRARRLKQPSSYGDFSPIEFRNLKSKSTRRKGRSKGRHKATTLTGAQWKLLHSQTAAEEQGGRGDAVGVTTTSTIPTPLAGATAAFDQKVDLDEDGSIRGHFIADDMLIPHHQKHLYDRHGLDYLVQAGTKVVTEDYKWANGVVDYKFETTSGIAFSNTTHQEMIKTALKAMEALTPLRFVETTTATDYISFQANATDGCWSYVGKTGGKQAINLGDGCMDEGTIMHEVGHSVGLIHEQSRSDRDTYVTINTANLIAGSEAQFEKATTQGNGEELQAKYDFNSLMHYGPYAFSKNGKAVIEVKSPYNCDKCQELGTRSKWCAGDIEQMVKMYTDNTTLRALYEPVWTAKNAAEEAELALHKAGCKDSDTLCAMYVADYTCPSELDGDVYVKDLCKWSCAAENPTTCSTYSTYTAANTAFNEAVTTLSGPAGEAAVQMAAAETERRKATSESTLANEQLAGDGDGDGDGEEEY